MDIETSVLIANKGPIYSVKITEIMEAYRIDGPFALGEYYLIKM